MINIIQDENNMIDLIGQPFYHVVGICNQRLDSSSHDRIQLQEISEGEKRWRA